MKSLKKIRAEMLKVVKAVGMNEDARSREMSKLQLAMEERKARPRWKAMKASKKVAALPSKKGKGKGK